MEIDLVFEELLEKLSRIFFHIILSLILVKICSGWKLIWCLKIRKSEIDDVHFTLY